ncbi:MAG: HAD family hydrolase [Gemmatimonadetes bacterium]|nr:HAD family hydrolase [Gemmatimonadota bacterium]
MGRPVGSIFEVGNAVLFDLDDTLIDRDRARDRFFSFLLNTYFPRLTPEGAAWTDRMETLRALDQGGRGSKTAIYNHCFSDIPGMSPESFADLMRGKLASYVSWSDGAEPLLECLRARRHPMAVVTNGSRSQRAKIDTIGASRYFDAVLISEEVGTAKPDPVIFRQAMSRLNAAPGRSVFIGDSLEHDIAGARNAGMMAVYLNRSGEAGMDESLCDLVVSDLRELSDRVIGLEA